MHRVVDVVNEVLNVFDIQNGPRDVFATWWLIAHAHCTKRVLYVLTEELYVAVQPSVSVLIHLIETKSVTEVGEWLKENGLPDDVKIFRGMILDYS